MRRSLKYASALFLVSAALLGACGDEDYSRRASNTIETSQGSLSVSAAASLRDAFDEIGADFTAIHPDVEVVFNFDSSSTLATQVIEGAPADVFASSDEANMTELTDAGAVADAAEVFARNELAIVTKPGNPAGIEDLSDLADAGIVALCGETVPCGRYARDALELAGVVIPESSVTRGQNAAATLTAVTDGDALAAIVYATDALGAGDAVEKVDIPAHVNVTATYLIAVLSDAGDADLARAFVQHVLSADGQVVLKELGFLPAG